MEVTSRNLHQGIYLVERTPWKLSHVTNTKEGTSWNLYHRSYLMELTTWKVPT